MPVCDYQVVFSKEETKSGAALHALTNLAKELRMYATEKGVALEPSFSLTTMNDQKVSLTYGDTVMTCWSHEIPVSN